MFTDVFEGVYKLRREVLCQIRGSACNYLYIEKSFQKLNSTMPNALESVFMAETEVKTNGRPEAKIFVFSLPNGH